MFRAIYVTHVYDEQGLDHRAAELAKVHNERLALARTKAAKTAAK